MTLRKVLEDNCYSNHAANLWADELRATGSYARVSVFGPIVHAWVKL